MQETFKDIPRFGLSSYYTVSNKGRILRKKRTIERRSKAGNIYSFTYQPMFLKPERKQFTNPNQTYPQLRFKLKGDEGWKTIYLARTVYCTFNNIHYNKSTQTHFIDGDSTNCSLSNLKPSIKPQGILSSHQINLGN